MENIANIRKSEAWYVAAVKANLKVVTVFATAFTYGGALWALVDAHWEGPSPEGIPLGVIVFVFALWVAAWSLFPSAAFCLFPRPKRVAACGVAATLPFVWTHGRLTILGFSMSDSVDWAYALFFSWPASCRHGPFSMDGASPW